MSRAKSVREKILYMTSLKYDVIYKTVIADGAFKLTRDEQGTYIKIEAKRGKSAIEIQKALEEVGSDFVLPYSSITRWVRQFNNGRNTISNKHLCGRPLSAKTGENVENVAKLLNDDRRYSCDEIPHELDISQGSVRRILTERLQRRKIAARWVPYMLLESEKLQRINIVRKLLKRYREDGDEMLQRIVANDETWIPSFELEFKRQSSEWHTKNPPKIRKIPSKSELCKNVDDLCV